MMFLYKYRFYLMIMFYLVISFLMVWLDILPGWRRVCDLNDEVARQNSQLHSLQEVAQKAQAEMMVKPSLDIDVMVAEITRLTLNQHLRLQSLDYLGEIATPYGDAGRLHMVVTGSMDAMLLWSTMLSSKLFIMVITDFSLQLVQQQWQLDAHVLLLPMPGTIQEQALLVTKQRLPICGVSWLKLGESDEYTVLRSSVSMMNDHVSLDWREVSLVDALHMMAKLMNYNVVLSAQISGRVNLQLQQADLLEAWRLLLSTYGIEAVKKKAIWYLAPRDEIMKQQQALLSWQQQQEQSVPLHTEIWPIRFAKAEEVAHFLQNNHLNLLSKRGHVHAEIRTNALCVQDLPSHLQKIRDIIRKIDVPIKQVLIKVRIASVDKEYERELGVMFAAKSSKMQSSGSSMVGSLMHEITNYGVMLGRLTDSSLLDLKLSALEQAGHAELISNPSLFTVNQQPAAIEAGDEIPYQEVSDSGGTAVAFKKAVLGLKVTPQVLPDQRVLLQLQVNQDRPSTHLVQGVPTISTHQIRTNVLVADGKTIVLGGVYEVNQEQGESRTPYLSQIPVVGGLFRQQLHKKNKRELLIFVTPKIMT